MGVLGLRMKVGVACEGEIGLKTQNRGLPEDFDFSFGGRFVLFAGNGKDFLAHGDIVWVMAPVLENGTRLNTLPESRSYLPKPPDLVPQNHSGVGRPGAQCVSDTVPDSWGSRRFPIWPLLPVLAESNT